MNQTPNHNTGPRLPDEVINVVHEAAMEEDTLRDLGASKNRISNTVHRPLSIALAKLAARGIDNSGAYPPEGSQTEYIDYSKISSEDEAKIDRLVDMGHVSYDEARRQVLGKNIPKHQ